MPNAMAPKMVMARVTVMKVLTRIPTVKHVCQIFGAKPVQNVIVYMVIAVMV